MVGTEKLNQGGESWASLETWRADTEINCVLSSTSPRTIEEPSWGSGECTPGNRKSLLEQLPHFSSQVPSSLEAAVLANFLAPSK